ncbi:hypothetical protein [Paenibacillus sp. FSL R5-0912]|uniref:hypothetical protein n=1 Tax=Paenibacillus sp. FSL R5-0912 TaxID=1536771 RepID=UPI0004F6A3F1|nr:hypothetical protein [Paenibacillus sp. FSL R5-0912]AIQ41332.1 hypothetical protein R50912_15810 [Paenibacillus sp. FSL R5-0912]
MSYTELLERKSEILKKTVENWVMKENRDGLDRQETHIYRNMLKELHQNEYELNGVRDEEAVKRQDSESSKKENTVTALEHASTNV